MQGLLERRIALENVSDYAAPGAEMRERAFLCAALGEADCDPLLDIDSIVANSIKPRYDATASAGGAVLVGYSRPGSRNVHAANAGRVPTSRFRPRRLVSSARGPALAAGGEARETMEEASTQRSSVRMPALAAGLGLALGLAAGSDAAQAQAFWQTLPQLTEGIELDIESASPFSELASDPLLEGLFRVQEPFNRFSYDARYSLQRGQMLQLDDGAAGAASPAGFGQQMFGQSLSATLPEIAGAPVTLGIRQTQTNQLTATGVLQREESAADVIWAPELAEIRLQWSAPTITPDPAAPVACRLRASVRVGSSPGSGRYRALRLGGRSCEVVADAPDIGRLELVGWSGGFEWGSPERKQQLTLSMIEAVPEAHLRELYETGYELSLGQTREHGRWLGSAELGLRLDDSFTPAAHLDTPSWTARADLRRRLDRVALSAGWQRAANPLWFAPGSTAFADTLTIGLDFAPALSALRWDGRLKSTLSYRWSNPYTADSVVDDALQWTLSYDW